MKLTTKSLEVLFNTLLNNDPNGIYEHSVCTEKDGVLYGLTAEVYYDLIKLNPSKKAAKHFIIVRSWEKDGIYGTDWEKPVYLHKSFTGENKNEVFERAVNAFNIELENLSKHGKVERIVLWNYRK